MWALLQKWFNIISKMIVFIIYHPQICPKWFSAVMTPRYIAFTLTKNWFDQSWPGMGNWYYMGCWVNVWNFREKKFFSKFQHFILFWEWFNCYFWIPHPKLIKVPIFIKIQWTKLKIWTKMHHHQFPRWPPRGWKRRIVVQTFNRNISQTIWDKSYLVFGKLDKKKFGTFTYLRSMYICSKFHWNLRRWVSGMSHYDVEFPQG